MNLRYIQKVFKVIKQQSLLSQFKLFVVGMSYRCVVYTLHHPVTIISSPSRKYLISEASCKMMY